MSTRPSAPPAKAPTPAPAPAPARQASPVPVAAAPSAVGAPGKFNTFIHCLRHKFAIFSQLILITNNFPFFSSWTVQASQPSMFQQMAATAG